MSYDPSKARGHNGLPEPGQVQMTPEAKERLIAEQRARLNLDYRGKPRRRKAGEFKKPPKV